MIRLEGIRAEHLDLYWPHVAGFIQSAIVDYASTWELADVRRELDNEQLQLWVIWDHEKIIGASATEIISTVRGKTCAIPIVGCDDMGVAIGAVLETVEAWAKSIGCSRLQGVGRKGWERALKPMGWKNYAIQIEKAI